MGFGELNKSGPLEPTPSANNPASYRLEPTKTGTPTRRAMSRGSSPNREASPAGFTSSTADELRPYPRESTSTRNPSATNNSAWQTSDRPLLRATAGPWRTPQSLWRRSTADVYKGRPASIDAGQVRQLKAQGKGASGDRESARDRPRVGLSGARSPSIRLDAGRLRRRPARPRLKPTRAGFHSSANRSL